MSTTDRMRGRKWMFLTRSFSSYQIKLAARVSQGNLEIAVMQVYALILLPRVKIYGAEVTGQRPTRQYPPVRFQNVVRHHRSKLHWSLVHLETILHAYSCKLVTKFPGADWKQSRGKKRKSNFTLFFLFYTVNTPPPFFPPFYKTVSA